MRGKTMKIGVILNTNDAETCWNCFRFGDEAISKNHLIKIFLLGRGVEVESVKDIKFPLLKSSIKKFVKRGGVILACGTCLKSRSKEGTNTCPISTMNDLLKLVEECDNVLTFG